MPDPCARPMPRCTRAGCTRSSGELEQGIAELRQGLAECVAEGVMVLRPYWKGYLAEALARAGRVDEGLAVLEEALEQVERTGERFGEAELRRLKGELLLQRGDDPEEAEACFRRAIEVAQRQEAKSWELRATTSLARLLREQGRVAEAREMLAAIYGWFTEGFDTPGPAGGQGAARCAELRDEPPGDSHCSYRGQGRSLARAWPRAKKSFPGHRRPGKLWGLNL